MSDFAPRLDLQEIESRWQAAWRRADAFATRGEGRPFYVLEMFPYPSGDLHMGHVRNYTIGDVFARFARMQGHDVLHPMGWDALGLPAENQAIREKVAPQERTPKNIARMRDQMQRLGLAYDWSREIATYQPEYYRWNQWFFLRLLERDLVYRRQSTVNFCPGCDTVLANEQVRDDGTCWRGHPGVRERSVPEWAFRITAYAEPLLADLDKLEAWPERIVSQQRHWIGKSVGARLRFAVADAPQTHVEVFTTRIDTLYGCTYVVLAPEHPLVATLTRPSERAAVDAFVARMAKTDAIARTAEGGVKEGVFTGAHVLHPLSGEPLPVWIANFVIGSYGTGAVMSVPAHDARDFAFAESYGLPVRPVVHPADGSALETPLRAAYTADGVLQDSGPYSGMSGTEARQRLATDLEQRGIGAASVSWHLRDWGFSRQRYWGTPIPIVYCDTHGAVPVPEAELPVRLPDFADVTLTGEGGAPLAKLESFVRTTCPRCQAPARREVETMDTFVDSAWYFARFLSPQETSAPFDVAAADTWLPVDIYVGGPEHAVMHLLYFRFWTKVMRELGLVRIDEPVRRLITQGMVNAWAFRCPRHGYVPAAPLRALPEAERRCPTCAEPLSGGIEKMSKSKYNGVDPLELIDAYGADTARLYTLFAAPPEKDLEWNPDGVEGLQRFVARVGRLLTAQLPRLDGARPCRQQAGLDAPATAVRRAVHRCLAKVSEEMRGRNHFNTAIAAMMELVNVLHEHRLHEGGNVAPPVCLEALLRLAQMLAPFAPHLAEEIWARCGGDGFVAHSRWPEADAAALQQDEVQLAVQVNGKLRAQISVGVAATAEEIKAAARADANVARYLEGQTIVKEVVVPKRLVNFVVRP